MLPMRRSAVSTLFPSPLYSCYGRSVFPLYNSSAALSSVRRRIHGLYPILCRKQSNYARPPLLPTALATFPYYYNTAAAPTRLRTSDDFASFQPEHSPAAPIKSTLSRSSLAPFSTSLPPCFFRFSPRLFADVVLQSRPN